jgi:vancomycin resistance protein YoaR
MKKLFRFILLLSILLLSLFSFCSCDSSDSTENNKVDASTEASTKIVEHFENYVVTGDAVNIRSAPDINSEIIDTYYKTTLIVASRTDSKIWYKVKLSDSDFAYVHYNYISPISDDEYAIYMDYQIKDNTKKYGVITEELANIRSLPNTDCQIIAMYEKNDTVEILATLKNGWYLIEYNNITCYISPDVLSVMTPEEYNKYISTPTKVEFDNQDNNTYTLIGSYSTDYYFSNYNREFNLEKASSEMNGMLIQSNAMFDWCRDMGPCGNSEGYLESLEIVNGNYVTGYGGGICQLSSTLCAAVITSESEFEFLERNKHALEQSYISSDLDATVSYPDCNLVIKNNNTFPIIIETVCSDYNTLTVNLYKVEEIIV